MQVLQDVPVRAGGCRRQGQVMWHVPQETSCGWSGVRPVSALWVGTRYTVVDKAHVAIFRCICCCQPNHRLLSCTCSWSASGVVNTSAMRAAKHVCHVRLCLVCANLSSDVLLELDGTLQVQPANAPGRTQPALAPALQERHTSTTPEFTGGQLIAGAETTSARQSILMSVMASCFDHESVSCFQHISV